MAILLWLLLGGLIGWGVVRLTRLDGRHDAVAALTLGIVGALIAGMLSTPLVGAWDWAWHPVTFVLAALGAAIAIVWLPLFLR